MNKWSAGYGNVKLFELHKKEPVGIAIIRLVNKGYMLSVFGYS